MLVGDWVAVGGVTVTGVGGMPVAVGEGTGVGVLVGSWAWQTGPAVIFVQGTSGIVSF